MAGIVGILKRNEKRSIEGMLESISHRGDYGKKIYELSDATIGMVWSFHEDEKIRDLVKKLIFRDGYGVGHCVEVIKNNDVWEIHRDDLGAAPMYFIKNINQPLIFASEVKALLSFSKEISELPPGHSLNTNGIEQNYYLRKKVFSDVNFTSISNELRILLRKVLRRNIATDSIGVWLSGGPGSSIIAALAKPMITNLHTFAAGLKDSPDLIHSREVAEYIGSNHHEIVMTLESTLQVISDVIYQIESFDVNMVRTGIVNISVAYAASDYVSDIFTGDGCDELFAGFDYLKDIPLTNIDDELLSNATGMHNLTLQRADRSASAFGLTSKSIFADPEIFEFSISIPVEYKIKHGVEKWILQIALGGLLPENFLLQPEINSIDGSGIGKMMAEYISEKISDEEFQSAKTLKNGWTLHSKEELYYYRIFKDHFGDLDNLNWVGRTKSALVV
jgi:asparagine synthase (glutamine-hydrolysing)